MQLENIPFGYCHCGCGEKTKLASRSSTKRAIVKGQPFRYIHGHHARKYRSPTYDDRYVERDCGYTTPCWLWTAGRSSRGYGYVTIDGRLVGAHRVVYELHKGVIPAGLFLDHLCRNRACVNPAHLEPVSHPENCRRGAGTHLTRDDAAEVRRLWENGMRLVDIEKRFGMAYGSAKNIAHGHTWREATPNP